MEVKDQLGERMKSYEKESVLILPARSWSIIRFDGKAFHTWTKSLDKPYSVQLLDAMQETLLRMCEQIPGAVCGYQQSDELSVVFQDFSKLDTEPWFGGKVQKIVSVAASMMTAEFNKFFPDKTPALFDARVFTLPSRVEVANNLLWRQIDARRNAVSSIASTIFSQKQLFKKSSQQRFEMLEEAGYDFGAADLRFMRGQFAVKEQKLMTEYKNTKTGVMTKVDEPFVRGVWGVTAAPMLDANPEGILLKTVLPKDPESL